MESGENLGVCWALYVIIGTPLALASGNGGDIATWAVVGVGLFIWAVISTGGKSPSGR